MLNKITVLADQNKAELPRARARFIAQSIQLEESDAPGAVRAGILVVVLLAIAGVAWCAMTPVNEVATAAGEIIPVGHNHVVQHLEGGIVAGINVRNGDLVQAGQVLLQVAPSATKADLEQTKSRRAALQLQAARLEAVFEKRPPRFGSNGLAYPDLMAREYATYEAQLESHRSQVQLAIAKVALRETELAREKKKSQALRREIETVRQQVGMRQKLFSQAVVARAELLDHTSRLAEIETEYEETLANIPVSKNAIAQARQAASDVTNRLREALRVEAGQVAAEIAQLDRALEKLEDRVERLRVRAPAAGIVKGLEINTLQSVVKPGEVIMEIVPVGDELIVESKISTVDIGHVHVGQEADVKVNGYDPQRFGSILGTVRRISASTYVDDENRPYYRAEIALSKDHLGSSAFQHDIIPGMTVQADIRTGEKSVLDYLLKPIYRGFRNAFQER